MFVLDAGRGFDVGSAQRVLADRIRAVPRLRQPLVRPPFGCGRPVVPGTGTPAERLERTSGAVRTARGSTADRLPVAVPPALLRLLAEVGLYRLYMRHQHRLHTLVSNVRGPDRPLAFAGAPVTALVPVAVAEAGNLSVTVIALSYAGTFTVTVSVDPDQVPDLAILTAALQAELAALTTVAGPPDSPRPDALRSDRSQQCAATARRPPFGRPIGAVLPCRGDNGPNKLDA